MSQLITVEEVEQKFFLIRNCRVMIDRDIAELYGVETKYLNRQVKRNKERFPEEFMFQLTKEEKDELVTNWHRFASMKKTARVVQARFVVAEIPVQWKKSRSAGRVAAGVR